MSNLSPKDAATATPVGLDTAGTKEIEVKVHCVAPSLRSSRGG